ncbi:MAG: family 78 glycoside hydrolase catalytic domain [Bacteroidetes bacterium]|nr:family 78 glycoside hydrolase catalytic domain [Bacteroidota bacterium]
MLLFFLGVCIFHLQHHAQNLSVTHLQCNFKNAPISIDDAQPQLSWQMQSAQHNVLQWYYRIIVSDKKALLNAGKGNIWDSKKIKSANIVVPYRGKPLKSATTYYWKVQVWDNHNNTNRSETQTFSTGLLAAKDWANAQWIALENMPDSLITVPGVHSPDIKRKLGPDKLKKRSVVPQFQKIFTADKTIDRATIYITGLGQYELQINQQKIGNSFLSPGWTDYDKRVLYNVYDVTNAVQQGSNVIDVIVGNGFYTISRERYTKFVTAFGYPKMICRLMLVYKDGTVQNIVSDQSWKVQPSAITFSSIYGGEDYDATKETGNNWQPAITATAPKGKLEAEADYPVTVKATLSPMHIQKPGDSVYVYDFGQNLSGIMQLSVKGKKGQVVKMIPAELLHANGTANQNATGKACYYTYTLKGDGIETWQPKFSYYGFRYVQVEGAVPDTASSANGLPVITSLKALHTSNASPVNGTFTCSDTLFNRINHLIQWAISSNLQSVATDCPHREKLSWLEQDYLMGGSINANTNIHLLYTKLVHDMMDAQTAEGLIPDIAPEFVFFDDHGFGFRDSPEWGSAAVILPWMLYKWYGDETVMQEAYPMMKKYVAYLQSKSVNGIIDYGLGDWYDLGPQPPGVAQLTPKALTATAIYYYDVLLLQQMALLQQHAEDAVQYKQLAAKIKTAFNTKFYNPFTKVYATGSQTAMAMPLCLGLVDEEDKAAVLKNLTDSITANGKKLTAGDIGFHFLIQALQDGGASSLIYDMNNRDDVPGYGYQLRKGATALTESWAALAEVSNNHLMLGHIMQWFYEGLAGIQQADDSYGYKHIVIKPEIVGNLSAVTANHQTIYGNIACSWEKKDAHIELSVEIPANTTATIYLPATENVGIKVNGKPLPAAGMQSAGTADNKLKVQTGSGTYHFTIPLSK